MIVILEARLAELPKSNEKVLNI